jgi:nicotinamide-nucleotide amidase
MDAPDHIELIVERVARQLRDQSLTISVAESLTGGMLTSYLAAGPGASAWLEGGIVAYSAAVKQLVLNVDDVPVVSETAARQMARGAARLFHSDLAVAVTGVGGPDGQNGDPPGTVWYALVGHQRERAELNHFDGDPKTVCESACLEVLAVLHDSLTQLTWD